MAYITDCTCQTCGKTVRMDKHSFKGYCPPCQKIAADQARRMHLASLKGLSLEERIEKIEAALYDLRPSERLALLEAKTKQISGSYA